MVNNLITGVIIFKDLEKLSYMAHDGGLGIPKPPENKRVGNKFPRAFQSPSNAHRLFRLFFPLTLHSLFPLMVL